MGTETSAAIAALGETVKAGFARMEAMGARMDAGFARADHFFELQQAQHVGITDLDLGVPGHVVLVVEDSRRVGQQLVQRGCGRDRRQ